MATIKTTQTFNQDSAEGLELNWDKYLKFVDEQQSFHTLWFLISLMVHCVLVPCTFLLVYTLNGPTSLFLGISMISFFINVVASMGGASTRFTIPAFFISLLLHLGMILAVIV